MVMVKFRLPLRLIRRSQQTYYLCGNHAGSSKAPAIWRNPAFSKILVEFDFLKFEENLRRIRIDFAQKRRFIANDNFKPVW